MTQLSLLKFDDVPLVVENPNRKLQRTFYSTMRGDVASLKYRPLWVVEFMSPKGEWIPFDSYRTRELARWNARNQRRLGRDTRVTPYKACLDTKARVNRQVESERIDY